MLKKIFTLIFDLKTTLKLLSFRFNGYLREIGWFNAYKAKSPLGNDNEPLPWVTYTFIDFIQDRLNKDMSLFEYGSGNSTLYYANRVKKIDTVEHDKAWYEVIKNSMPQNVSIHYVELIRGGDYCKTAAQLNMKYDIIIVDGRDRVNCVINSQNSLSEKGILVLDDSERTEYNDAFNFMKEKGYRNIGFWGFGVGLFYKKCTTIFYKDNNCLGI